MMNCLIKLFILFLNVLILSACNDAITRFWNNTGWEPPPKEKKAEKECFEELRHLLLTDPEQMRDRELYEKWRSTVYEPKYDECMRRKGFGYKQR